MLGPFKIATFTDTREIAIYDTAANNGLWMLEGKVHLEKYAMGIVTQCGLRQKDNPLNDQLTRYCKDEMLWHIQANTYINREDFQPPAGKIPLLNGVYDYAYDDLEPHRERNHFTFQVPVKYDETATCPKIDKFLGEVLGERKMLGYEIAGYALAESTPNKWQRAFMLIGPGDNGKSTFLNLLIALFGAMNVSNQTLQSLVENRFSMGSLVCKLANIASDIGDKALFNAWQFKALTGGDRITAEHKFKSQYEFQNRAILIFSCNTLPESYDDSDAYHKRSIIAQFDRTFTGPEKDPKLLEKLTTPEELSGFFNQSISAYREMEKRGLFTGEGSTAEKRDYYVKLSDPIQTFIDDELSFDPNGTVNKTLLYEEFRQYCQKRGYGRTRTKDWFYKHFRKKTGDQVYDARIRTMDGTMPHYYKGIKLTSESEGDEPVKPGMLDEYSRGT